MFNFPKSSIKFPRPFNEAGNLEFQHRQDSSQGIS